MSSYSTTLFEIGSRTREDTSAIGRACKTLGHAESGQGAILRTFRDRWLLLVRTARHRCHVRSRRHRCVSPYPRGRWCRHQRSQKPRDRQDREQSGEDEQDFHAATMPDCAPQEKVAALTFSPDRDGKARLLFPKGSSAAAQCVRAMQNSTTSRSAVFQAEAGKGSSAAQAIAP